MARSNDSTDRPWRATELNDYQDGTTPSAETPDGDQPFVLTVNDQREQVFIGHPAGTAEAGFDLTRFSSADSFQRLVENHHLEGPRDVPLYPSRQRPDVEAGDLKGWVWADEYVLLMVAANPLTGARARIQREPDPGYAGYIGIKGERASVQTLFHAVRRRASECKGYDNSHSRYIR